LRMNVWVCR